MEGTRLIDRHRISIDDATSFLLLCEQTEDHVRIKHRVGARYTIRGVPAKRVDVVAINVFGSPYCIFERVDKAGRYDGAVRRRYTLAGGPTEAKSLPAATLDVDYDSDDASTLVVALASAAARIEERWKTLRSDLSDYKLARVMVWHWTRYYRTPLPDGDEIRRFADAWASGFDATSMSLAEVNRAASRELYRLAVANGYRKMTARERAYYGIDGGMWQLRSTCESILAARRDPSMAVEVETATHSIETATHSIESY